MRVLLVGSPSCMEFALNWLYAWAVHESALFLLPSQCLPGKAKRMSVDSNLQTVGFGGWLRGLLERIRGKEIAYPLGYMASLDGARGLLNAAAGRRYCLPSCRLQKPPLSVEDRDCSR